LRGFCFSVCQSRRAEAGVADSWPHGYAFISSHGCLWAPVQRGS